MVSHSDVLHLAKNLSNSYPLIVDKISKATGVAHESAGTLLNETIKYLFLVGHSRSRLTPSIQVDLAWHEFILFTKVYEEFCMHHFGHFIHHHPGESDRNNQMQFVRTLEYYKEYFGTPDPRFWGNRVTSCGSCEGGV